jgi:pullulanase-type alpha-1,6-glucosidase
LSTKNRLILGLLALLLLFSFSWGIGAQAVIDTPETVTIAGTIQSVLGCESDWDPACEITQLVYEPANDLWRKSFDLPAGEYEYKAALNGTWDLNFGLNAQANGENIPLVLAEATTVQFLFDTKTGWVTDTVNSILANVPGNYQDDVGCPGEWQPTCLLTRLQDPDGDGVYVYSTPLIPPGEYEAKVALNESWTLNYGLDGARDGANIPFIVPDEGATTVFSFNTADNVMTIDFAPLPEGFTQDRPVQRGNLQTSRAHWVTRDTIAWNVRNADANTTYQLFATSNGGLVLALEGIENGRALDLTVDPAGLSAATVEKFPHLEGMTALKLDEGAAGRVAGLLRGQVAIAAFDAEGALLDATSIQIPGVLDDVYGVNAVNETLGISWEGDVPTIKVWAPTAKSVGFLLYATPDGEANLFEMTRDDLSGVWSITGTPDWYGQYYLFAVNVYVRSVDRVVENLVTDPYSVALSLNSTHSQIVNLRDDPALAPDGWDTLAKPEFGAPEDITLYELHIRDFSVLDQTVTPEYRGTYLAFTEIESAGMQHLIALADAGLSHLHLLPTFDLATINEDKSTWGGPDFETLSAFPPDSDQQQALISATRDQDPFNWGYDPYHYNAPEGSYAVNPDARIFEFRQMVQSLNQNGLRVVMDVVYNHTNAVGQADRSVLDKIVPGYYYRLDQNGNVTTSTCCPNTATEHLMMEKLMIDSLLIWAIDYKIDGFRFDLMGHHMLRNMQNVRAALDALTVEADGVDGRSIYVYGEGWNFGEVGDNARGVNATQLNIGGLGIGTFSDRLRDAARGGNPFGGQQEQGFINGLFTNPNGITPGTPDEQRERLFLFSDQIRIGLAGNLAAYRFTGSAGDVITGADVPYGGSPTGYTLDPQEHIVYVDKHDNETLFDIIQFKAPIDTPMADRVRMQNLGISVISFSQGIPFYHAGMDMLRSKSLDRNSYNSGDWFNALDFSYETNGWGRGLPMAADNQNNYPIMQPLLANPDLMPTREHILTTVSYFREVLQIRYSSPLFRLQTAEQVQAMLTFQNTGPDQLPGVIAMTLTDSENIDPIHSSIVVIFNATNETITLTDPTFADLALTLHPVQFNGSDEIVKSSTFTDGTFTIPALTTAVFVVTD